MNRRRLYFVRHGLREDFENESWRETAENPWDPPISACGREQAADIGAFFAEKTIHGIFSSPFLRTLETAQAVACACGAPVWMEEALCEWLNPEWHNVPPRWLSPAEAAERFPAVDAAYVSKARAIYPEAAESREVLERCKKFLDALLRDRLTGDLVFVTHGSPLGQGMAHLLGGTEGIDFRMAAITELEQNGSEFHLLRSGCDHLRVLDDVGRFV